ncbi:beta strand repeat-containing protein [Methylotenera sp. G11]|uniref:beta strand repeat-containing protein n=1 Tax=Methylotenera sp. G11 TaxID=1506585 RepID=UPI001363E660|nr:filamentous hemagglutinin N-terminal domain-containing protein [Methylotenera sp. G11]
MLKQRNQYFSHQKGCCRFWLKKAPFVFIAALLSPVHVFAGLEGGVIVGGQGAIVNSNLVVQDSARLAINAAAFGVQAGETFVLKQNFDTDIALIRVLGQDPSSILGNIHAKGQLFISNPNGVLFGSHAQVNVGGLVATTLGLDVADFMAGRYVFSNPGGAGSVVNQGRLTAAQSGYIALLAPEVRNEGVISASLGTVLLAAGDKVTLNLDDGSLFGYTIDQGAINALAENRQLIQADGGQVFMGARAADAITTAAVNNTGIVRARTVKNNAGVIRLSGDAVVSNTGTLDASAANASATGVSAIQGGSGGEVEVSGRFVALGGQVNASGWRNGGQVNVVAGGDLSLSDHVLATGVTGNGGHVSYQAGGEIIESSTSYTDVSGVNGGSISVNAADGILSSGTYHALGTAGIGGHVDMSGYSVRLLSAEIDASGVLQGGLVRIGGAFQGGKYQPAAQAYDQFVTRWQGVPEIDNAQKLFVNDSTRVNVSSAHGVGGTAIFWSDKETTQLGRVNASGAVRGGAVEISSAETLRRAGLAGVTGADTLLLDPKNIIIGDYMSISSWTYNALIGAGYAGGNNVDTAGAVYDYFGTSVALNAAGTLLAVGLPGDDGAGNVAVGSGAVQLFSFTDGNFSGGTLRGTIGRGYTGGNNVDIASLDSNDFFGSSVSLNAVGDRLAVGALGDDGAGNLALDTGAAYLFAFADNRFTAGSLQAVIGKGYAGGNNRDVSGLETLDGFGSAVALNGLGNRLAVGAYGDDGAGNIAADSGAVYLYGFADNHFTGGNLLGMVGKGYTGSNNLDVVNLGDQDRFGIAAAFNSAGDRLAVGAFGDDGAANLATDSGAVYLLGFVDGSFTGGSLLAIAGKGYSGSNNMDVANLESSDGFGRAVALNAAGDRLAVGAFNDDGAGNLAPGSGAVYQFGFMDANFAGGSLQSTIGKGYAGTGDFNLAGLDTGDYFGTSVALNGLGDRLVAGAILDDGSANAALDRGAVYLFSQMTGSLASTIGFADYSGQAVTVSHAELASMLSAGTNVVLQASNDITVSSAVAVNNASGDGGSLMLQAGRNIHFDAGITTDNGNLSAVAGDTAAIPGERDPGIAAITIANGVTLDAGLGSVTLAAIGGNFINNSGSSAPLIASRWAVYSTDPALNTLGGMLPTGKHYNQAYVAGSTPAYAASGNWLFYSIAPVLSVTPGQQTVSYGDHPGPYALTYNGFIDGDNAQTSGISGNAVFSGGGSDPGSYDINYVNGLLSSLGYTFVNNAASQAELLVVVQPNIPDAQKPPNEVSGDKPSEKPLAASCGEGVLITSSSGAVFERFIDAEEDTCGLDFTADESADGNDSKKRKCKPNEEGSTVKDKAQKP